MKYCYPYSAKSIKIKWNGRVNYFATRIVVLELMQHFYIYFVLVIFRNERG